ncbi:MAG: hypothetical protein GC131_01540 [Alphaproteobacteria bacterium]|nr:hypothetical protein [Alphaproteobacteria bacterium]
MTNATKFMSSVAIAAMLCAGGAHAQNVAVPYTPDNSADEVPSLGFAPAAPIKQAPVPTAETDTKKTQVDTAVNAAPQLPNPKVDLDYNLQNIPAESQDIVKRVREVTRQKYMQAINSLPKSKTEFLDVPENVNATLGNTVKNGSNLTVTGIAKRWSNQDLMMIAAKTGFNPEEAAQKCRLAAGGVVETDKGAYIINVTEDLQGTTTFEGVVKTVSIMPSALCNPPSSPPKDVGAIVRVGKKYVIALPGATQCTPPRTISGSARISYEYDGNGVGRCTY